MRRTSDNSMTASADWVSRMELGSATGTDRARHSFSLVLLLAPTVSCRIVPCKYAVVCPSICHGSRHDP